MRKKVQKEVQELEKRLGHRFRDRELLIQALTHPSYAHERAQAQDHKNPKHLTDIRHYQRLEFLGDAVVDLVISHLLMDRFEDLLEGDLSRLRASLVNFEQLSELAVELGLDKVLLLGHGEEATGGSRKPSILAAVYEAVVGAIYLDGGFEAAFEAVSGHYKRMLERLSGKPAWHDYKTEVQEKIQALYKKVPSYRVVGEKGPQHRKTFDVEIRLGSKVLARGKGMSKKEAEQDAARKALEKGGF
jgi:ribonuclease-3